MKKGKRILAAVTAAAMTLLIAPELGGEVSSQIGKQLRSLNAYVSAEESEDMTLGAEPVQSETETDSSVTDDVAADDGISAQSDVTVVDSGVCGDNATWTLDNNGVLTISGTGKIGTYSIKPWYNSMESIISVVIENGITSIGGSAFQSCENLESVLIADSVTNIDDCAFAMCTKITNVTIPSGVRTIRLYAFAHCTGLKCLTIPDSVTYIGNGAFKDCTSLTNISICKSGTSIKIADQAFADCTSLKHIHIPSDKIYSDYAGLGNLPSEPSCYFPGGCDDPDCPLGGGSGTAVTEDSLKKIVTDNYPGEEILFWECDDFCNTSKLSAFAIVGREDNMTALYAHDNTVTVLKSNANFYGTKYSDVGDTVPYVAKLGDQALFVAENGAYGSGSESFAWAIGKDINRTKQIFNTGMCLTYIEGNDFVTHDSTFDNSTTGSAIDGIGHTWKPYYLFWNGSDFSEYGGIEITEEQFLQTDNGKTFIDRIKSEGGIVGKIFYRSNNIININYYTVDESLSEYERSNKNITLKLDGRTLSEIETGAGFETGAGIYVAAMFPDIAVYPEKWDIPACKTYTVKWYNGETLIETQECPEKTIPEFKGNVPSCYDDEYGLKREFLGWTTKNNVDYDIHIPEILGVITSDTSYYAVFSEKEPEVDTSDEDIDKIDYIYEHMEYAKYKQWNLDGVEYANDFRYYIQNNTSETTHYIWRTVQMTDKAVNLDVLGITDEIRANDYNAIMLDMFNSIEGYEAESTFFNEAENKAWQDFEDIVMGWGKYVLGNEIKYQTKLREALDQFDKDRDIDELMKSVDKICDETGLSNAQCIIPKKFVDIYNLSDKVFTKVNLSLETIQDVIKSSDKIAAYRMYQYMSDEYRDILLEMYNCAGSVSNSDWEVKHLKEAIAYALNYYYKTEEQAADDFMIEIMGKTVYNLGLKKTVQDFFKKGSEKFMDKALASETAAGSAKPSSGLIIAAIQNGFKFGVMISDSLFDQSDREDMYVKIKEYGVLSETLQKVLDNRASRLLSVTTIDEQYDESKHFDKAFKMFMYIEAAAYDNIADYEKSFEVLENVKIANTALVGPVFSLIANNQLDKDAARHVRNAALFADHAKFMRTLKCHTDGGLNLDEKILLSSYGGILKEHKIIIVSCPIRMNVYDENNNLIGSLSAANSNVVSGYEDYIYRMEETDSCVACVPVDYTVEIVGLDDGTMKVIGSYYSGKEQKSTFSYNNVSINSNYRSTITVTEDVLELDTGSDTPVNPSNPINPSEPPHLNNNSDDLDSSDNFYLPSGNTFTVKTENKVTGRNGTARAVKKDDNITVTLGKNNDGYYANIYDSNGNVFDSIIIKNGKVKFAIPSNNDFYIIIEKESHIESEDVSSGAGIYELVEKETGSFSMLLILFAALGIISVQIIRCYQKNKR